MNENDKHEEQQNRGNTVTVNTNPEMGPLDGAEAQVFVSRTDFFKDEEGKDYFKQAKKEGNIKASYSLGVMSISVPEDKLMLTVRLDEVMQVMFASAGAYKKVFGDGKEKKEESKDEGKKDV